MTSKGCLLFAHNNSEVDYSKLAILSASLVKKYLDIPSTLVTDIFTHNWMIESGLIDTANNVFEKIIVIEFSNTGNTRVLHDGQDKKIVPFTNSTRASAYELSPYDHTLLIDSDFLIFSNTLNQYWDLPGAVKIAPYASDINHTDRLGYHDKFISDTGVHLYWATTVMFDKSKESKMFFDLVETIRENYRHFADLYMFNNKQFRNDIAFSIAKHIFDGFSTNFDTTLPPLLTVLDTDILNSVEGNKLTLLISSNRSDSYVPATINGLDVHIMNKQSIIRNYDILMENL